MHTSVNSPRRRRWASLACWLATACTLALSATPVTAGTVVAWGANNSGQTTIPAGLTGVTAISAGYIHNLALKTEFTLKGFNSPVQMGAAWNSAESGSTVPLKFNVFSGPVEVTDVAVVQSITQKQTACPGGPAVIASASVVTTAGSRALRYANRSFIQNWKVPALTHAAPRMRGRDEENERNAPACYIVTMTATDGSSLAAQFQVKQD